MNEEITTESNVPKPMKLVKRDELGRVLKGEVLYDKEKQKQVWSIKAEVRKWLETHPNEARAFIKHFVKNNKELTWQMLEGRPAQDLTSAGQPIVPRPLDDVHKVEDVASTTSFTE